ncbi:hypothetical protein IHC92_17270 [Photobacterium damselae subsp. damselae]|uniref:hypothetical protein n=1 Tax=Photobacterium damselae TaxID=38293 RepID=UPI001F444027|nr:hypothetical protein [Photobacterium damselae]UKA07759.1 hypothetical protein IHC90_17925 [Photobacterium damselae subsp. damselae]UKA23913.1 hypothetical protein IHC92_17270 [Photobacterium damselae subsp. damselae]
MVILTPEVVLPDTNCTIVRHESYGSTSTNKSEIVRSIKANFDNGYYVQAFTIVVHANPKGSSQEQELAYLIEYSDGHIELFDKHSMSINRSPRESEVLSMIRTLVYLGFGDRLFYCTKRLYTQVFQQTPLLTITVIKAKGIKSLLPHWHEFTSVNNEAYKSYPKSAYKAKEWDKIADLTQTSINKTQMLSLMDFVNNLYSDDEVIVGYVGRSFKKWIFVYRRGRKAYITFCDERTIRLAYHSIVNKYSMKAYSDFIKDSIIESNAQRLLSVNQDHFITEFNEHYHKWLFEHVINNLAVG